MKVSMIIQGKQFTISDQDIRKVAFGALPEKIRAYYVDLGGKRFSPKQLIRLVTKTTDSFNSSNARSILTRLGFTVKAL